MIEEVLKIESGVIDEYKEEYTAKYDNILYKDSISRHITNDNKYIMIGSSTLSQIYRNLHDKIEKNNLDLLAIDKGKIKDIIKYTLNDINRRYKKCMLWVGVNDLNSSSKCIDGGISIDILNLLHIIKTISEDTIIIVERTREGITDKDNLNNKLQNFNLMYNKYIDMFKFVRLVLPIGFNFDTSVDGIYYKSKSICNTSLDMLLETLCIPES